MATTPTIPPTTRSVELPLPPALRRVLALTLVLTTLSAIYALIAHSLRSDPIYWRAFSPPGSHFTDFTIYELKFHLLFHTSAFFQNFFPFTYPAPVALVYESFIRLFPHPARIFVGCSILAAVIPAVLFGFALRRRGLSPIASYTFVGVLLLCSWPALLVIDRANMEIVVWVVLAIAAWAFATGRWYVAAIFFGLAASLKLFPFIFLGLFLSTRRYKELSVGILSFFAASLIGLAVLGPTVPEALHGISGGLHQFQVNYMAAWNSWENGVDHSLFATYKFVSIVLFHHSKGASFQRACTVYNIVMAIFGILLYAVRIRRLPLLNQLLILSIASILFTGFSGDGTLLHLYYPFAMLCFLALDAHRKRLLIPGLDLTLCILAAALSYEGFFVLYAHRFEGEVKCLVLVWLMIVAFRYPFSPPLSAAIATDLARPDASRIPSTMLPISHI